MTKEEALAWLNTKRPRSKADKVLVDELTGCWNWQLFIRRDGYGQIVRSSRGGGRSAHRAVYEMVHGSVPDGMQLDHKCRNIKCVNPDHLEPVTHAENIRRGRAAKLTDQDVLNIHKLYRSGVKRSDISKEYPITRQSLDRILRGERWKDLASA